MPILQYNLGGEQPPQGQNNESGRPASSNQAKLESLKNTSDRSQRGFSNIGARSKTKFPKAGVRSTSGLSTGSKSPQRFPKTGVGSINEFINADFRSTSGFPNTGFGSPIGFQNSGGRSTSGIINATYGFPNTGVESPREFPSTGVRSTSGYPNAGVGSTSGFPNAGVGSPIGFPNSVDRSTSGFPNTSFRSPSESRYYSGHYPNNFQPLGNHHDQNHVVFNRIQPAEAKQQTAAGLQQETNCQLPLYQAQTENNYHPSLNQPSSAATIHPIGYQKTAPIISFVRPNVLIYTHVVSIPPAPYFPDLQHHRQAQDQEICRTIDSFQTSQGFGPLATQIQDPRDFGILNRYQTADEARQGNNFHAQQTTFQVKTSNGIHLIFPRNTKFKILLRLAIKN